MVDGYDGADAPNDLINQICRMLTVIMITDPCPKNAERLKSLRSERPILIPAFAPSAPCT